MMCFGAESEPPIAPLAGAAIAHQQVSLTAEDGNRFTAFRADAEEASGVGVLVLPDYRGLTGYYEELALRFAEAGMDAVAIDYYGRTAGTTPRDADFEHLPHTERTTWQGLRDDIGAAAAYLRTVRSTGSLFSIGFCFGGRASLLLATRPELAMAGVIGFYGWPVGPTRNDMPAPAELVEQMVAPVLGVFGGADEKIPQAHVDAFEQALTRAHVEHRLVTYAGAPHSFFDRQAVEHADASEQAWAEVLGFVRTHVAANGS